METLNANTLSTQMAYYVKNTKQENPNERLKKINEQRWQRGAQNLVSHYFVSTFYLKVLHGFTTQLSGVFWL